MHRVICLTGHRAGDLLRLEGLRILAVSFGAAAVAKEILGLKEAYAGLPTGHDGVVEGEALNQLREALPPLIAAVRAAAEEHCKSGGRLSDASSSISQMSDAL